MCESCISFNLSHPSLLCGNKLKFQFSVKNIKHYPLLFIMKNGINCVFKQKIQENVRMLSQTDTEPVSRPIVNYVHIHIQLRATSVTIVTECLIYYYACSSDNGGSNNLRFN